MFTEKLSKHLQRIFHKHTIRLKWARLWLKIDPLGPYGRIAARLASMYAPPYKNRVHLSFLHSNGYIHPHAIIAHPHICLHDRVYIGANVIIHQAHQGGDVNIGSEVQLYRDIVMETGSDGSIYIGEKTHIQPRCFLSAYKGSINIGSRVEIAPNCAFYPYNHGINASSPVRAQPFVSKGNIYIGDDAWLGYGVIILHGVTIGKGAVIGAGSVVTKDIPESAIAVGNPARVIGHRK